jgi:alpha-L-fucosidase 2
MICKNNLHQFMLALLFILVLQCTKNNKLKSTESPHDLVFKNLAQSWDEAIPLGNGHVGALVWQNGDKLRFSLDRADLWDLRPMENLKTPEWSYQWIYSQWLKKDYKPVQDRFDTPYNELPAPTKIPAGALEFDIQKYGPIRSVRLFVENAVCKVLWENGLSLTTFVHADSPEGWFLFDGLDEEFDIDLKSPAYNKTITDRPDVSVTRRDLQRLGYPEGTIAKTENTMTYDQEGWGGFKYKIFVQWEKKGTTLLGCWSISSENPGWGKKPTAVETVERSINEGFNEACHSHYNWWENYWDQSSISIPDELLEKQYYLEMYKFGSAARADAPPISLQAVWTADDGLIPPWKGDFHHDLNTQLSYWPSYAGNQMALEDGYVNWLWKNKATFENYTKTFYGKNGLNVPGVSTLSSEPMGGWVQYSLGPTVSAWLAHHFYLHWQFTRDRQFLQEKAYPWIRDVAIFLDDLSVRDKNNNRKLPISSSPEIFNNSWKAWFKEITNFDLALIRWTFEKAAELANEIGNKNEADKWTRILNEWPDFAIDDKTGFMFVEGFPYDESHRHFSHLMAFHPLGLVDWSQGEEAQKIINNTLSNLEKHGSDWWTGYSFSWQGNLYARALDGEKAAHALRTFSTSFCLPTLFTLTATSPGPANLNSPIGRLPLKAI